DEVRFRSNIAVEGWPRWSEEQLIGAQIHVGEVPFAVGGPIIRCAATHANPATGLRDARVMTTLTRTLRKAAPALRPLLTAAALVRGAAHRRPDPRGRGALCGWWPDHPVRGHARQSGHGAARRARDDHPDAHSRQGRARLRAAADRSRAGAHPRGR